MAGAAENPDQPMILEALQKWSAEGAQPDKKVWTFLSDKGEPVDSYTYKELNVVSSTLATSILLNGISPGDR